MAGSQVEVALTALEKQRLGYQAISLTEFDTDNEPEIAAGSKVEIGGALFEFSALESITGWAGIGNSNDVYIKLVVAGVAVTAEFTTSAPTWSTSKQGWYDALDRYIGGLYKDASGDYTAKYLYEGRDLIHSATLLSKGNETIEGDLTVEGDINTDGDALVAGAVDCEGQGDFEHGIMSKCRISGNNVTAATICTALGAHLSAGEYALASGYVKEDATGNAIIVAYVRRSGFYYIGGYDTANTQHRELVLSSAGAETFDLSISM